MRFKKFKLGTFFVQKFAKIFNIYKTIFILHVTEIELQIILKSNEISFNQILVKRYEITSGYSFSFILT